MSVVKSLLLSLSYHDWKKCNVSYYICCAPTLALEQLHPPLPRASSKYTINCSDCSVTHALDGIKVLILPVAMSVGRTRRPSDWAGKYSLVSGLADHDRITPRRSTLTKSFAIFWCLLVPLSRRQSCYALCPHDKNCATPLLGSVLSRHFCVPRLSWPLSRCIPLLCSWTFKR